MKRLAVFMAAVAMMAVGCAKAPARDLPAPAPKPVTENPAPQTPANNEIPAADQVCLKTDDGTGVRFGMARAQSDGGYQAGSGWTVTWQATQILSHVEFPRAVDPASVKITVEPSAWVYTELRAIGHGENVFPFAVMPADAQVKDPLLYQQAKPGWLTIKVTEAKDKSGQSLLTKPASLKVYVYDPQLQGHDYLQQCLANLAVPVTNH